MKRYIINLVLYSIVSLWMFSSCEDYDFKDIPDPVIPEDMTRSGWNTGAMIAQESH